jgi:hypothetical protein
MPVSDHARRYYDLPDDEPLQLVHVKRDCPRNISIFNLVLALLGWRPSRQWINTIDLLHPNALFRNSAPREISGLCSN